MQNSKQLGAANQLQIDNVFVDQSLNLYTLISTSGNQLTLQHLQSKNVITLFKQQVWSARQYLTQYKHGLRAHFKLMSVKADELYSKLTNLL